MVTDHCLLQYARQAKLRQALTIPAIQYTLKYTRFQSHVILLVSSGFSSDFVQISDFKADFCCDLLVISVISADGI